MRQEFFSVMMDFVFEAEKISSRFWGQSHPTFKKDRSIVTLADKKISALAYKKLHKFLSSGEHILIEEEDKKASRYFNAQALNRPKYIWSIDPIDGTRNYANQIPSFGISIGLFKNLKPWMGVVYFPALREMFFHDGLNAYFVENVKAKGQRKRRLRPLHVPVDNRNYFLVTDTFFKEFDWEHKDCRIMIQSCGTMEFCWPAIARGCASLTKSNLWDFAGAWPIVEAAGLTLRSLQTGKRLTKIDLEAFNSHIPWRLKDFYIISDPKNFPLIRKKIKQKF